MNYLCQWPQQRSRSTDEVEALYVCNHLIQDSVSGRLPTRSVGDSQAGDRIATLWQLQSLRNECETAR